MDVKGDNSEQASLWNGVAGQAWVDSQDLLDRMLAPFEPLLVQAARERRAARVLDVGCGTGATTLAVARALGADGSCTGVDISAPMIGAARARAERAGVQAQFVCADAQTHPFAPDVYDLVVSRFGVMFFADPVRAFANLRAATRGQGGLRLIVWRGAAENPFMTAAERAAAPLLPEIPAREPDAPGQFGFADPRRVRRILEDSGWHEVEIAPVDLRCAFPASDLDAYLARLGPLGRALHGADAATRDRVLDAVRPALAPYLSGDEVSFAAACWQVSARNRAEPAAAV